MSRFLLLSDEVLALFLQWLTLQDLGRLWVTSLSGRHFKKLKFDDCLFWYHALHKKKRSKLLKENRRLFLSSPRARINYVMFDYKGVAEKIRRLRVDSHRVQLTRFQVAHLQSSRVKHAIYWGERTLDDIIRATERTQVKRMKLNRAQKQAIRAGCFPDEVSGRCEYAISSFWKSKEMARCLYSKKSLEKLSQDNISFIIERYPFTRLQIKYMNTSRVMRSVASKSKTVQEVLKQVFEVNDTLLTHKQRSAIELGCHYSEVDSKHISDMDLMAAKLGHFFLIGKIDSRRAFVNFLREHNSREVQCAV